jgi:hypothetical protein
LELACESLIAIDGGSSTIFFLAMDYSFFSIRLEMVSKPIGLIS